MHRISCQLVFGLLFIFTRLTCFGQVYSQQIGDFPLPPNAVELTNGFSWSTTAKTNINTGDIYTTEVFFRSEQSNLVCNTVTAAGILQVRDQKFYHVGVFIGDYVTTKDSSHLTTEPDIPYSINFEFSPSKDIRSAVIGRRIAR
jgi:hypothetical protein